VLLLLHKATFDIHWRIAPQLSAIVIISISSPVFLVALLPLALLYLALMRVFIPTSRQVQRFESSSKSPVNLHFSETISGVTTLRAFGEQDRFIKESQVRGGGIKCLGWRVVWFGFRGAIHQLLNIILKLRILVLLHVSTLPYVVKVKNYSLIGE
jgi:ABC-type multidrug transport system fused ATPase/permease subunit